MSTIPLADLFAGLTTPQTVLLIMALGFGFYMAWSIGANDVANAMVTSVGSGALTLKWAIILAAIFEFGGAYFVGANVSSTIREGIFDPLQVTAVQVEQAFDLDEPPSSDVVSALSTLAGGDAEKIAELEADDKAVDAVAQAKAFIADHPDFETKYAPAQAQGSNRLAMGMIASLLAAGLWLQIASYFGWPVSTTHSIVGAVVGFGCVVLGLGAINWFGQDGHFGGVAKIAASWVVSPLLAGSIAYLLFNFVHRSVLNKPDPVKAAKNVTPFIVFFVVVVLVGVTAFKGLKNYFKQAQWIHQYPKIDPGVEGNSFLLVVLGVAVVLGLIGAVVSAVLVRRVTESTTADRSRFESAYVTRSLDKARKHLRRVSETGTGQVQSKATELLVEVRRLEKLAGEQIDIPGTHSRYKQVEKIFAYLQILSACFVAFAHGANDVANAIGPLSAAVQSLKEGAVAAKAAVPAWALLLGGAGIVFGLATWGWRVMQTIGKKITELTPTRGFCAEMAAATTILFASLPFAWAKVPISTTHTLVGAVLGVGVARGIGAINLNTVRDIAASWIITIPAGAGLSILFYYILRLFFA